MAAINDVYKNAYEKNIMQAVQQDVSRLESAVDMGRIEGEYLFMDTLQSAEPTEIVTRLADTNWSDTDWERRSVYLRRWYDGPILDRADIEWMMTDPKSALVERTKRGMSRQKDRVIIEAFDATVKLGKNRDSDQVFDTNNVVTAGSGLTIAKLREVKKILDVNEMMDGDERYIVVSPVQIDNLLGTTEATSSDYNSVKTLVSGDIDTFMGFKFITSNLLTVASSVRVCFAWTKSSMQFGLSKDITVRTGELEDKHFAPYVYTELWCNALRVREEGVVKVNCTES